MGMQRFDLELRVLLAFAFVNGIAESSVVPLLPSIRDDLELSALQTGLLLSTTTLAMLVAAIPVGYAANRFGTRGPAACRERARCRWPSSGRRSPGASRCSLPRASSSASASGSSG